MLKISDMLPVLSRLEEEGAHKWTDELSRNLDKLLVCAEKIRTGLKLVLARRNNYEAYSHCRRRYDICCYVADVAFQEKFSVASVSGIAAAKKLLLKVRSIWCFATYVCLMETASICWNG